MHTQDIEDVFLWPCGVWCYRYELGDFAHKSDDCEVLPIGSPRWLDIVFDLSGAV